MGPHTEARIRAYWDEHFSGDLGKVTILCDGLRYESSLYLSSADQADVSDDVICSYFYITALGQLQPTEEAHRPIARQVQHRQQHKRIARRVVTDFHVSGVHMPGMTPFHEMEPIPRIVRPMKTKKHIGGL
jgi:hypothetical protein